MEKTQSLTLWTVLSETLWLSLNKRLKVLYNWRMWCLMRSKISCAYVCLADQCKASTKKSAADWGNCCNRCSGRGIVVPEWGPLKRIQQSAVESQLCAPIGAVCWNDPCKSIRSVFWASEVKHFYTCSGLYTTDVYVKKDFGKTYHYIMSGYEKLQYVVLLLWLSLHYIDTRF